MFHSLSCLVTNTLWYRSLETHSCPLIPQRVSSSTTTSLASSSHSTRILLSPALVGAGRVPGPPNPLTSRTSLPPSPTSHLHPAHRVSPRVVGTGRVPGPPNPLTSRMSLPPLEPQTLHQFQLTDPTSLLPPLAAPMRPRDQWLLQPPRHPWQLTGSLNCYLDRLARWTLLRNSGAQERYLDSPLELTSCQAPNLSLLWASWSLKHQFLGWLPGIG